MFSRSPNRAATHQRMTSWPEIRRRQRAELRACRWRQRWATLRALAAACWSGTVLVVTVGLVCGAVVLGFWRES